MPLIQLRKIWTPLEIFRIEFFHSAEEKQWYIKLNKRKLKRIF